MAIQKSSLDYSLYLVTDSTPAILGGKDIAEVVDAAIKGGVSVVQYRDKTSDDAHAISVARRLHEITKQHGVPLLINDRVDVALAVGCEGVHVGQDDMELAAARRKLGPDAIIGVTASSVDEALAACKGGADYLGIGTIYATATKKDTKSIIGPGGLKEILQAIYDAGYVDVRTVCIGGINASTAPTVLQEADFPPKPLDGVAVVSAIVAATDPAEAARELRDAIKLPRTATIEAAQQDAARLSVVRETEQSLLLTRVVHIIQAVHDRTPLSHNMTNLVVQNFAANVALAVGASPIMANYAEEAADLARLGGSLVINMGTVTPDGLANYVQALRAYNAAGGPVVYDPVGAGATAVRRAAVAAITAAGRVDVVKGNEGEIQTVAGAAGGVAQQRGVDSASVLAAGDKAQLVRDLARRQGNVALLTGKTDFVSDGARTYAVDNGHAYLGMVTGTGCVLGTTISAMLAVSRSDKLAAAVAGLLHFEIAAEIAAEREDVKGPGTFVPAFIDELYNIRQATAKGELGWLQRAKLTRL